MTASNDFQKLSRPKIVVDEDLIVISDPPIVWRIAYASVFLAFTLAYVQQSIEKNVWDIIICGGITLGFLYGALSLNRVRVDLRQRVIYRTTLNPIANLLDRILQHPSVIPFDKITKFEVDYPNPLATTVSRYYLLVEYDGIYKLTIGIFKRGGEAENVADFLRYKIKMALARK